jgi:hypothetical protein
MEVPQFWLDSSDEFSSFSDGSYLDSLILRVISERLGTDKSTGARHRKPRKVAVESKQNIGSNEMKRILADDKRWSALAGCRSVSYVCDFAPSATGW